MDWFRGSPEMPPDTNTWREFSANLAPYDNVVTFRERYEDAADFVPSGLSLVHLDADHSYEATRRAFELYAPKVVRGGHVVFHDAWIVPWDQGVGWPGVTRFVTELGGQDEWEHVADADRSAAFQRR